MAIGVAVRQDRFENPREILGDRLRAGSVYRFLADHGDRLFPDDYFADLYARSVMGRPTVPARTLATVMVLQSFEGLSDREATDRLEVDLRWQAAAGVETGVEAFHPTALVGQRNRLRASARPRRLFEDTKLLARSSGVLKDRARVLDSTPLHDAVATQDTVTQLRAAIRKVLTALTKADPTVADRVRSVLMRDDSYATPGKPPCDWDDREAREVLVDGLVRDANAVLECLDGERFDGAVGDAVELLAVVAGQDVAEDDDAMFRIVRGVAKDRVISTVDPAARHGHKSRNRRFDGYKTHISVDPDSEIIDEVVASPANMPDRDLVDDLLAPTQTENNKNDSHDNSGEDEDGGVSANDEDAHGPVDVVGDSAYADGDTRSRLGERGHDVVAKVPPVRNRGGRYSKDRFRIDVTAGAVTCPADHTVPIRPLRRGGGKAAFGVHCGTCPLRTKCTTARRGRSVTIHRHEALLQKARADQATPQWDERYRADRPIVERKIAHFARRLWGGRNARCRGLNRISTDLDTRAAAINLARLATLGLTRNSDDWTILAT